MVHLAHLPDGAPPFCRRQIISSQKSVELGSARFQLARNDPVHLVQRRMRNRGPGLAGRARLLQFRGTTAQDKGQENQVRPSADC